MKLIEFAEQTVVFAKNQPEYLPLPAFQRHDAEGTIICCWQMTFRERIVALFTGRIWHSILTFNSPLQPQLLQIDRPIFVVPTDKNGSGE